MKDIDLAKFSGEHLYFEIKMLFEVSHLIESQTENIYIYNALIDSYVLHTSILIDFFYKPKMKADDAKAIDFMKDREGWKKILPSQDKYFRKIFSRRNRELVHLSYKRLQVTGEDKAWYPKETTEKIKALIKLFLLKADPNSIHEKLDEFKN